MADIIQALIDYLTAHPELAGLIVFVIAMGEALFIIGMVVPSTTVLMAAGTLVGLGKLGFWPIFIWTMLGAVAGDAISYWIGRVYHEPLRQRWPFNRYGELVARGEAYFRAHGAKSVFIGRFVPGIKAVVPGIAGMVGMDSTRFTIINVVSAIVWTLVHLGPGILAGAALGALGAVSGRLTVVLGGLLLVLVVAVVLARWLVLVLVPLYAGTHEAVVAWLRRRPDRVSQWLATTFDPQAPRATGMLAAALVLMISVPAFLWLVASLSPDDPMALADASLSNFFAALRTPWTDRLMVFVTLLGDGVVTTAVASVAILWLLWRRAWRRGLGLLIAIAGTALFVPLLAVVLPRAGPVELLYVDIDGLGFPSGHATLNAVLYGILAVLVARDQPRWARALIYSLTVIYVVLIGFSRIYLSAHWPSDVLGGLLFGVAMVAAFAFLFGHLDEERVGRWPLAALVGAALMIAGGWHVMRGYDTALAAYAPQPTKTVLPASQWLADGWQALPARRIELGGETGEPLLLQWAGGPAELADRLKAAGWTDPPPWSLTSASMFLFGQTAISALPVLPSLHNGRDATLTLVHADAADPASFRWVLRLWPSPFVIDQAGQERDLLVGSIIRERILHPLDESTAVKAEQGSPPLMAARLAALPGKIVRRGAPDQPASDWNGEVMLAAAQPG